jgi:hypothetical protein
LFLHHVFILTVQYENLALFYIFPPIPSTHPQNTPKHTYPPNTQSHQIHMCWYMCTHPDTFPFFSFFWWYGALNSEPCAYQVGTLHSTHNAIPRSYISENGFILCLLSIMIWLGIEF